jgi:hypothetical protein
MGLHVGSTRRGISAAMVAIALGGHALHAAASTFDIKGVEVTKGETELEWGAAWQNGFPANADPIRQGYEASLRYGLTSWLKAGGKIGFDQPDGERLEATVAGVDAQAMLVDPSKGRFGLAWFSGVDFGLQSGVSDVLTFGPLVSLELAKGLEITLNPLFQRSWGPSSPGIDFNYGWQIKREITDNVAIGAEGYGVVPDIGHAPAIDFQEHRAGPVLYLSHEAARGGGDGMKLGGNGADAKSSKIELQIGVLFGFTDATADTTGRAKLAITW